MDQLTLGRPGTERVYRPSFVASDLVGDPEPVNVPLGVLIGSGKIPAVSQGGLVHVNGQEWGVDHVAGISRINESGNGELIILGSDKSDVQVDDIKPNIGSAREEGLIILSNIEEERIIIGALVARCNGWTAEKLRRQGLRVQKIGDLVVGVLGINARIPREFRISATNGTETVAKPILGR